MKLKWINVRKEKDQGKGKNMFLSLVDTESWEKSNG